jgi:hypothetical protein
MMNSHLMRSSTVSKITGSIITRCGAQNRYALGGKRFLNVHEYVSS